VSRVIGMNKYNEGSVKLNEQALLRRFPSLAGHVAQW
jgi:hypothetical protein